MQLSIDVWEIFIVGVSAGLYISHLRNGANRQGSFLLRVCQILGSVGFAFKRWDGAPDKRGRFVNGLWQPESVNIPVERHQMRFEFYTKPHGYKVTHSNTAYRKLKEMESE